MSEVRSICVLCQREQNLPKKDNDSHTLCFPHIRSFYGDEVADQVINGLLIIGCQVKTTTKVVAPNGAQIDPGTRAMVVAVQRDARPKIFLVETLENEEFEQEEFFCFADDLEVAV